MRSSFFEYQVASSGLFAARAGLETVSHNIANAGTPGYSRQVAELRAARPLPFNGKGMMGTGASFVGVTQMRNVYLDKKYWSEMSVLGEYNQKRTHLNVVESLLDEVNETGLHNQFSMFFDRLEDLTAASGDLTFRKSVTELGHTMASQFKHNYSALQQQQKDMDDELIGVVGEINNLGYQISTLNKKIYELELYGDRANDLRDERARVVDKLSKYVNVTVQEREFNEDFAAGKYPDPADRGKSDARYFVYINGNEFVSHYKINTLECRSRKETTDVSQEYYRNPEDVSGLHDVYWSHSNAKFNIHHPNLSGELKALADLRDGNNGQGVNNFEYIGYDSTSKTLQLKIQDGRVDLHPDGGILTIEDGIGIPKEIKYTKYTYDIQTGEATFVLKEDEPLYDNGQYFADNKITYGKTSDYKGIPYYLSRLNDMVRTFAKAINEGKYMDGTDIKGVTGHIDGFDSNNENLQTLFFTYTDADGNEVAFSSEYNIYEMTAENLVLNSVLNDPKKLAAAISDTSGSDNNDVILGFIELQHTNSLFREGNIFDYISGMATELAIDVKQASLFEESYIELTETIDTQRMSVSGVNLNEEIMNMIRLQAQYRSAAKLMSVIDGIYNTTINNMGIM